MTEQKKTEISVAFFFPPPALCVLRLLGTRPSVPCLFWHPAGNSVCQVIIQGSHMYHLDEIKLIVFLLKVSFPQRKLIHLLSYSPSGDQENKTKKKSVPLRQDLTAGRREEPWCARCFTESNSRINNSHRGITIWTFSCARLSPQSYINKSPAANLFSFAAKNSFPPRKISQTFTSALFDFT